MSNHPEQDKLDWNANKNQSIENMRLRDLFIMAALNGTALSDKPATDIATRAIHIANAVMQQRGKL